MKQISIAFILILGSCDGGLSMSDLEGPQRSQAHQPPQQPQGKNDMQSSAASLVTPWTMPGGSPSTAGASCQALLDAGVTLSGVYWVINPNSADSSQAQLPTRVYCDQDVNRGGWALVYNSVLGASTLDFWNIPYVQRLGRRGRPSLDSNYYDGSLYQIATVTYMDAIEDLQGKTEIAFIASATGFNNANMKFDSPVLINGHPGIFNNQFAAGWSAPDYDGDVFSSSNCATYFSNVTQHYGSCWYYNLGSDADLSGGDVADQRLGPHVANVALTDLGTTGDGSIYSRVRAIRRYVKW